MNRYPHTNSSLPPVYLTMNKLFLQCRRHWYPPLQASQNISPSTRASKSKSFIWRILLLALLLMDWGNQRASLWRLRPALTSQTSTVFQGARRQIWRLTQGNVIYSLTSQCVVVSTGKGIVAGTSGTCGYSGGREPGYICPTLWAERSDCGSPR